MSRYEFRIWDQDLAAVRSKMEQGATPSRTAASTEIYLISEATDYCTAKIRDELLDIKVLLKVERRLEQWSPIVKAAFPLPAPTIAQMFEALKLAPPRLAKSSYAMEEFLNECRDGGISAVTTSKLRNQFELDRCKSEFAAVTFDSIARQTVAVESENPNAVLAIIERLGIAACENVSYVRNIKSLLPSIASGGKKL